MEWTYGGRYYHVTALGMPDGYAWELEDVAPTPGRGILLEAVWKDADGSFTFRAFTDEPLPFALVQRFVNESAEQVPPPAGA